MTPLRWAGVVTGGLGLVGLGIAGGFTARALSKKSDSAADCAGDVCGPVGTAARNDARTAGNVATGALVAGAVLTATGIVLIIVGRPSPSPAHAPVAVVPALSPGLAGLVVWGSF